jgi:sterol desaturase/sphingolipid hydroxylase (fatty acid hydroxylase superfamily)
MLERIIRLPTGPLILGLMALAVSVLGYVLLAGTTDLLLRVVFRRRCEKLRLTGHRPDGDNVRREVFNSLRSALVYAFIIVLLGMGYKAGVFHFYFAVRTHGVPYLLLSTGLLVVLHDAYFYWAHRLMHHPILYKHIHSVHHRSIHPTPWAAFSFSPGEAFLLGLFLPIVALVMPIHPIAVGGWQFIQTLHNAVGHSGCEVIPQSLVRFAFANTVAHHQIHHEKFRFNYGLHFPLWDNLMGTTYAPAALVRPAQHCAGKAA